MKSLILLLVFTVISMAGISCELFWQEAAMQKRNVFFQNNQHDIKLANSKELRLRIAKNVLFIFSILMLVIAFRMVL